MRLKEFIEAKGGVQMEETAEEVTEEVAEEVAVDAE